MQFIRQRYTPSDEAVDDAICGSQAVRADVDVDLATESVADATKLLKFWRLLETNDLIRRIFIAVDPTPVEKSLQVSPGICVGATIINAPPSTKNAEHNATPICAKQKKGNEWCFGMKAHIGVDAVSGLVHSLTTMPAIVADIVKTEALLRGDEEMVFADAG